MGHIERVAYLNLRAFDVIEFLRYSMFHVTWITFKFNRNQLGTILAFVMSSVPWSNQRAHQVIDEKLLPKEFHCRTKDHKLDGIRRLLSLQSYF